MRMLIVTENGRFVGAQQLCAERKPDGHLDAQLVAGQGQRCQELDVPDEVVPRDCSDRQAAGSFMQWVSSHLDERGARG